MPRGKHRADYQRPRTGEKRARRRTLKLDVLPEPVRQAILTARAEGATWEETAERASKVAGCAITDSAAHRWYDLRVAQVQREVMAQAESARQLAAAFASKGFTELPDATVNALSSEVFGLLESGTPGERTKALGGLLALLTDLIDARAKDKRAEIEGRKLKLAEKKFDDVKEKADRATNEAATKLGKGKGLTIEDINRLRRNVFGLGPAPGS